MADEPTEQDYLNKGYRKVSEEEYNKFKKTESIKMKNNNFDDLLDYDRTKINGQIMFFVKGINA